MLKKEIESERFGRYKIELLRIINKILPECKVYLFGSRARLDHSQGSDIDLALDAGKKIDFKIILDLYNKIEDTNVPLTVDLVDLHSVDSDFKKRIDREKILWTS